jgi:leader peptidase (prepilin peptidase) / N-methyltransferase
VTDSEHPPAAVGAGATGSAAVGTGATASAARLPAWLAPTSVPVVLFTVALAIVVGAAQDSAAKTVLRGALVLALMPCALIDIERRIIPNRITGPGAIFALVAGLVLDPGGEPARLLWAAIAGGFLLLAALAHPAGMGMGDVKLTGMIGLFLGRGVVIALLVALVASVLTGLAITSRRGVRRARKTALPFGPYLALGAIVAAVAGDPIIHAYLHTPH